MSKNIDKFGDAITLLDIKAYKTLRGDWRAYVVSDPSLEAWGHNKDRAVSALGFLLAEKNIPFDFDDGRPDDRDVAMWLDNV